jgi:hypothetical protein
LHVADDATAGGDFPGLEFMRRQIEGHQRGVAWATAMATSLKREWADMMLSRVAWRPLFGNFAK